MLRCIAVLSLLSLCLLAGPLRGQVARDGRRPVLLSGYATATAAEPELRHGHALGGSGGFILERTPWMQLDVRGTALLAREPMHTMIAEAGPRVSRSYGRLRPYGELLVGIGHTEYEPDGNGFGLPGPR